MSKEYKGTSYMLIVKDQITGRWSLLKKFLLLEATGKLTGSYISSSWYQQKVMDLEKPIEYFLISVEATTTISDIINDLVYRINSESYQFSTLINEFDYLYDKSVIERQDEECNALEERMKRHEIKKLNVINKKQ